MRSGAWAVRSADAIRDAAYIQGTMSVEVGETESRYVPAGDNEEGSIGGQFSRPRGTSICARLTSCSMTSRRAHRYTGPFGSLVALTKSKCEV